MAWFQTPRNIAETMVVVFARIQSAQIVYLRGQFVSQMSSPNNINDSVGYSKEQPDAKVREEFGAKCLAAPSAFLAPPPPGEVGFPPLNHGGLWFGDRLTKPLNKPTKQQNCLNKDNKS